MKIKIIITSIIIVTLSFMLTGCTKKEEKKENNKLKIVTTIFPPYDFAKAVTKDNAEIKMLLKPGGESHSYEPTPQDIIDIQKSDIFIYIGGESDAWVEKILESTDKKDKKIIKLIDHVKPLEEEEKEGMEKEEHEHEEHSEEEHMDEHIWTSPKNAIKLVNSIKNEIIDIDSKNKNTYEKNANEYTNNLNNLDKQFEKTVKNGKRKYLIFGDRFPFRYFVEDYGLDYSAAFPGCATDSEPSVKTVAYLKDKVKDEKVPVVFHIEFSNKKVAKSITENTNAKILEFHSAHEISASDFKKGITYIDIFKKNLKNLKEALK